MAKSCLLRRCASEEARHCSGAAALLSAAHSLQRSLQLYETDLSAAQRERRQRQLRATSTAAVAESSPTLHLFRETAAAEAQPRPPPAHRLPAALRYGHTRRVLSNRCVPLQFSPAPHTPQVACASCAATASTAASSPASPSRSSRSARAALTHHHSSIASHRIASQCSITHSLFLCLEQAAAPTTTPPTPAPSSATPPSPTTRASATP